MPFVNIFERPTRGGSDWEAEAAFFFLAFFFFFFFLSTTQID
jgi:hypothetical protein